MQIFKKKCFSKIAGILLVYEETWIEEFFIVFSLILPVDNAYDPDVDAKQIWIDKTKIRDMECLTFRDDGNGLSRDLMHHMLRW